jgi:hypothetical protein
MFRSMILVKYEYLNARQWFRLDAVILQNSGLAHEAWKKKCHRLVTKFAERERHERAYNEVQFVDDMTDLS